MHYNAPNGAHAFSNPFTDAVARPPPQTGTAHSPEAAPHSNFTPEKRKSVPKEMKLDVPTLQNLVAAAPGPGGKRGSIPAVERDDRGYLVLQGRDRWGITPVAFSDDTTTELGRKRSQRVKWIEGLRGVLGLQTLLWIFFRIFAPACVTEIDQDGTFPADFIAYSPSWTGVIRRLFSPILFDGGLQMTMFIILIGRVSLLTYFERREALGLAGPCFRRPFRLALPIAVTLGLVTAVTATGGFRYATFLADRTHNSLASPPVMWDSALEFWNSLVTFFFAPITYKDARAVAFIPPAGISWFVSRARSFVRKRKQLLMLSAFTDRGRLSANLCDDYSRLVHPLHHLPVQVCRPDRHDPRLRLDWSLVLVHLHRRHDRRIQRRL